MVVECLNHSNPEIQQYIKNLGIEDTYRQYILHNYSLPDYTDFLKYKSNPAIQDNRLLTMMGNLLNLTEFQVRDIEEIRNLLPANTEGAFWKNVVYLSKFATGNTVYEESFHAIFQAIIPDSEKSTILRIGRYMLQESLKGKTLKQYLSEQRIKYPELYINQSVEEQIDRIAEEHLASEFVKYASNPSAYKPPILDTYMGNKAQSMLQRVINFFKRLLGLKNIYDNNTIVIETFFNNIAKGKYKNARIKTRNQDDAAPFTRLINLFDGTKMSANESTMLEQSILASTLDKMELEGIDANTAIEQVMSAYSQWYSDNNEVYRDVLLPSINDFDFETGTIIEKTNTEYYEIVNDIKRLLADVKSITDVIEDTEVENNDIARFDEQANQKGYTAQSLWLKSYISTSGKVLNIDEVEANPSAVKIIQAVEPSKVYYSLLRASRNAKSDEERIRTFINFAGLGSNEQNKIFLDSKLRKDIRHKDDRVFTEDEWNSLFSPEQGMAQWNEVLHPKSKRLLAKMMKGFDMWVRENMELFYNVSDGKSSANNANARGVDTVQYESWKKNYDLLTDTSPENKNKITQAQILKIVTDSIINLGFRPTYKTIEDFNYQVDIIKKGMESIGIPLAKEYIEFSLYMAKHDKNTDLPIIAQLEKKYTKFRNNVGKDYLDSDFYKHLIIALQPNVKGGIFNTGSNTNIRTRLKAIARGNAIFDENAMDTSYIDPEGNTIYLHQNKTFNLQFLSLFSDWNAKNTFERLATGSNIVQRLDENGNPVTFTEDADFFKNNFMLKWLRGNDYKHTARFTSFSVAGITPKPVTGGTDEQKQYATENAVTFSSMQTRDFDLYRLNVFFTKYTEVDKNYFAPIFVGNNEAKNTAEFINMPVHDKLINNEGKLSQEGIDVIYQEIKNEYDRIQRITKQIPQGFEDTYEKYNTGSLTTIQVIVEGQEMREIKAPVKLQGDKLALTGDFRALQFTNSTYGMAGMSMDFSNLSAKKDDNDGSIQLYLSEKDKKSNLLLQALLGIPIEQTNLKETIPVGIDNILNSHIQDLITNKIVRRGSDGMLIKPDENTETLLHPKANILYPKDLEVSLRKMLVSNVVNTMSLNQLMMGDPALSVKNDFVDLFKRNGGRNAAIVGFRNEFIDTELGITEPFKYVKSFIFSEPTAIADNDDAGHEKGKPSKIDLADAQNWTSVQYFRKALWGQTKLTSFHARVLNDIESGKPIAKSTMERLLNSDVVFNSMKTVGFTGKVYHKKSDKMLTREETSYPEFLTREQYVQAIGNDDLSKGKFGVLNGTQLPDRADYTFYTEDGTTRYVKWLPKQEKYQLHELRLRLSGFTNNDSNGITYNSNNEVDIAMPLSASKMTSVNVYNVNGGFLNVQSRNISAMDANFYGLQTENPSGKEKIVDPTQMLEIIMSELKGKVGGINLDQLKYEWDKISEQRDNLSFNVAYKELAEQVERGDISNFKDMILRGIIASGGDIQTQQFLNTRTDINGNKFDYNLNLPLVEGKFIQQFFAYFSKEILSQKIAGDSKVLVSSYGHNIIKKLKLETVNGQQFVGWEVINEQHPEYADVQKKQLKNLSGLRYDHKVNGEVVSQDTNWFTTAKEMIANGELYAIDSLRHNVPQIENGKITGWFSEGLMPTHNLDIETIEQRYANKFGVRIPSQDKQSAINIKWVGMMPAYFGSSIVIPKEVVYLSGADFDVDKLYVQDVDTYVNLEGEIVPYGSAITSEGKWYEYLSSIKKNKIVKDKIQSVRAESEEYLLAKQKYDSTLGERKIFREQINEQYNKVKEINEDLNKLYAGLNSDNSSLLNTLRESAKRYRQEEFELKEARIKTYIDGTTEDREIIDIKLRALNSKIKSNRTRTQNLSKSNQWEKINAKQAEKESLYTDINQMQARMAAYRVPLTSIENKLFLETLQRLDLPTKMQDNIEEYISGSLNNRLLEIKQHALNNLLTLQAGGISKTPITLDALKELKSEPEFPAAGKTYGSHWYGAHSNSHKQNTTGKGLIGVSVISMLGYINALKLGVRVNSDYIPKLDRDNGNIDGFYKETSITHKGETVRVMDLISTITSANTDEAKEQLNAYFGMSNDSQAVVLQMISLGYPLKSALMLIKQPVIQYYIGELQKLNYALRTNSEIEIEKKALTPDTIKRQTLSILGIELDDFNKDIGEPYTSQDLSNKLLGKSDMTKLQKVQVFKDFLNLGAISNDMGTFVSIVRLKKGLMPDIQGFDLIQSNADTINKDKLTTLDFGSKLNAYNNRDISRQLRNFINPDGIIKKITDLSDNLFLQKNLAYINTFSIVKQNVRIKKNDEAKFKKAISSFMMNQLDGVNSNEQALQLLYSNPNSLANQIKTMSLIDSSFKNNPLIRQLALDFNDSTEGIAIDNITIDTISKLTGKEQETLIDSFEELFINEKYRNIAENLFTYFKLKDAFQFGTGNLSKIFPASMFTNVSQRLNDLIKDEHEIPNKDRVQFMDSYLTHSRNISQLNTARALNIKRTNDLKGIVLVSNDEGESISYIQNFDNVLKRINFSQGYSVFVPIPTHGGTVTSASSKYKVYTEKKARQLLNYAKEHSNILLDSKDNFIVKGKTDVKLIEDDSIWQSSQQAINDYYNEQIAIAKVQMNGELIDIADIDKKPVVSEEQKVQDFLDRASGVTSSSENKERVFRGKMTYNYGTNKREDIISQSTFEAIEKGERTATTRYENDGNIDYWKQAKIGDIIEFEGNNNTIIKVEVTKPLHKLEGSGKTPEQWSKLEGWSVDYFNQNVRPKLSQAWQIEFKIPSSSSNEFPELARLQQELELVNVQIETFPDTNEGIIYTWFKSGGRLTSSSFNDLIDKNKRSAANNGAYVNNTTGTSYDLAGPAAFANAQKPMDDGQAVRELEDYITEYTETWSKPYNDLIAERNRIEREIDFLTSNVTIPKNNNPKQPNCL